jgi:hypothetical protein
MVNDYPITNMLANAQIKELYGDMAWGNFNAVFKNHGECVQRQYGKTISVTLSFKKKESGGFKLDRSVKEDMSLKTSEAENIGKKKAYK